MAVSLIFAEEFLQLAPLKIKKGEHRFENTSVEDNTVPFKINLNYSNYLLRHAVIQGRTCVQITRSR